MEQGEIEKLEIRAYTKADYSSGSFEHKIFAMVNPETYTLDYKIEYQDGQGQGASGAQQKFTVKSPEQFDFELLFDSTGVIDGKPRKSIVNELNELKDLLLKYEGETHEPKHFMIIWGEHLFKGRCTGLNINYKLFKPNGAPIRAICKASFKGSVEDSERAAEERKSSPDLTHFRAVKAGDTLPLLCYDIYGTSSHYIQVALANKLSNFRSLEPGTEIFFPPIEKNTPVA